MDKNELKKCGVDFIGIGTNKSGTTWISACLHEHPQICHSQRTEGSAFHDQKIGAEFIDAGAETSFFSSHYYHKGLEFYREFYKHCKKGQIRGEFSPGYLYSEKAAERINEVFPNAKLIVSLRNPIERAYSQYTAHAKRGKHIWLDSFDEMSNKPDNPYFTNGLYYKHLQRYFKLFPRKNILILILEDSRKDPKSFIQNIYTFLGVDNTFIPPSLEKKINPTAEKEVRYPKLNQWLIYGKLGSVIKKKVPFYDKLRLFLKRTKILEKRMVIARFNNMDGKRSKERLPMSQGVRTFLQNAYNDDTAQLEILLNRKLDFWK